MSSQTVQVSFEAVKVCNITFDWTHNILFALKYILFQRNPAIKNENPYLRACGGIEVI